METQRTEANQNMIAFIDYTRLKISDLARGTTFSLLIIIIDTIQVYGVLQKNITYIPGDQIQAIKRQIVDFMQLTSFGLKTKIFMVMVFMLILINIMSTIYIVNFIKNHSNQITSIGRLMLVPDKIINFFFNWVMIIPLTQCLMIVLMVKYDETQTQQDFFFLLRIIGVLIGFVLMIMQSIYILIFFNCLKFETEDHLQQKECFFQFGYVFLKILMTVLSFLLPGKGSNGFIRDFCMCLILLILLVKHYQDFPFKCKLIQKVTGGILLWLFFVSLFNLLDTSIGLNNYVNLEMMKIVTLILCLKLYSQWTESQLLYFFVNFKSTFQNPNNFFQTMYELTGFNTQKTADCLPDMVRAGLFDNMQTVELTEINQELENKELKFRDKQVLCDYIYEIIHKFRMKNIRKKNNISLIVNVVQFMLFSANNPKLCFGFVLQCLQRRDELPFRTIFWLMMFRRISSVILDRIIKINSNKLGQQNFQLALDFEARLEDTCQAASKVCQTSSEFLISTCTENTFLKQAKKLALLLTDNIQTIDLQLSQLAKINDKSQKLFELTLGLKTYVLQQSKGKKDDMKNLQQILDGKKKNSKDQDLANLSVHHHKGCIVFLNADIDNQQDAGKITRCSKKFVSKFGFKSKDEVIMQNIKIFIYQAIAEKHQQFVTLFISSKKRFNNALPITYGMSIDGFVIPISIIVKLSTQCFESLSIAGFIKFQPEEDMYILTDMMGNIGGWTKSVNKQFKLQQFKNLKYTHKNIILICPHLIDFIFPKNGDIAIQSNYSQSFDQNFIFYAPNSSIKGFKLYEEKFHELEKAFNKDDKNNLLECRQFMLKLFDEIDFSSGGGLYKLTLSVTRTSHRFNIDFLVFKIGFYTKIEGLQQKLKKKKQMIEQQNKNLLSPQKKKVIKKMVSPKGGNDFQIEETEEEETAFNTMFQHQKKSSQAKFIGQGNVENYDPGSLIAPKKEEEEEKKEKENKLKVDKSKIGFNFESTMNRAIESNKGPQSDFLNVQQVTASKITTKMKSTNLLDMLNEEDIMASEDVKKEQTNADDSRNNFLKDDGKGVDHSISSVTSQISNVKISSFYDYQDTAIKFIIYMGRIIFLFLICSVIGVFYYSIQTVDKIKQYYSIQLQPMAFSEDIMLIQKEIVQLFLLDIGRNEMPSSIEEWNLMFNTQKEYLLQDSNNLKEVYRKILTEENEEAANIFRENMFNIYDIKSKMKNEEQLLYGMKLLIQHAYQFTNNRYDLDTNLVEAKNFFTMNLVEIGSELSLLTKEIYTLGVTEVESVFKKLYISILCCVVICCIVSFLIIPLQQFYTKREKKILTLCRTFPRIDILTQLENIHTFLKSMNLNYNCVQKISSFLETQKEQRDKRIVRNWRGGQTGWFNRWIICYFLILNSLFNPFFICEFILLSTSKNDISLQFNTAYNQGQFSYSYYSYNLGLTGMIYQRLDDNHNLYEFDQFMEIKTTGLTLFEERIYDYFQFRRVTSDITRVFSISTREYILDALDNGICNKMHITLDQIQKERCLKLEGEEEIGLYPMLKDLNSKLWHTFVDLDLDTEHLVKDRIQVIINVFQIDNMFFFVRNFMSKFQSFLYSDYTNYIDNIQYINWGIFGFGFLTLCIGWYFVMGYVQKRISSSFGKLKTVLKIYPMEIIKNNRYITSYLENFKNV